mmetsp:Transcript_4161/g.5533  ORF Transcript_4161/g.5533 Transcript_4161/m.5533 type:complete len:83 (+) Transcript_4161:57-305(+)
MSRSIKIKQLQGADIIMAVDPDITISELKSKIQSKTSMPAAAQRLIYKARPLQDASKLSEYVTENDQVLHLVAIPSQAGGAP